MTGSGYLGFVGIFAVAAASLHETKAFVLFVAYFAAASLGVGLAYLLVRHWPIIRLERRTPPPVTVVITNIVQMPPPLAQLPAPRRRPDAEEPASTPWGVPE